jgi:hypothetical protein
MIDDESEPGSWKLPCNLPPRENAGQILPSGKKEPPKHRPQGKLY